MKKLLFPISLLLVLVGAAAQRAALTPLLETSPVSDDADDPAIWVHPRDASRSLVIGTDKVAKTGGLYVFDLQGLEVQHVGGLDRPNNVDVVQAVRLGGEPADFAVCTERMKRQLRIFRIDRETGVLSDVSGATAVFADRRGEDAAPMGVAIYRKSETEVYVVVSPKEGPVSDHLALYRLEEGVKGTINARFVRYFGKFSGQGEIEALAVDAGHGTVFAADEGAGIRSYVIEPDASVPMPETGFFGRDDYQGDREGMAVLHQKGRTLLVGSDQIEGGSRLHVYDVTEKPRRVAVVRTASDETDGLDIATGATSSRLPEGVLVMMNSGKRNFHLYDLRSLLEQIPE